MQCATLSYKEKKNEVWYSSYFCFVNGIIFILIQYLPIAEIFAKTWINQLRQFLEVAIL